MSAGNVSHCYDIWLFVQAAMEGTHYYKWSGHLANLLHSCRVVMQVWWRLVIHLFTNIHKLCKKINFMCGENVCYAQYLACLWKQVYEKVTNNFSHVTKPRCNTHKRQSRIYLFRSLAYLRTTGGKQTHLYRANIHIAWRSILSTTHMYGNTLWNLRLGK